MTAALMTPATCQDPRAGPGGGLAPVRARVRTRRMGGARTAQIPYARPEAV